MTRSNRHGNPLSAAHRDDAAHLSATLSALSDPTRRAVIDLLRGGPRRAGELASALNMSAPALSRHLKIMRRSGLICGGELEDDARVRLYRLEPGGFGSLRAWIHDIEGFWEDQLDAFAQRVEERGRRK